MAAAASSSDGPLSTGDATSGPLSHAISYSTAGSPSQSPSRSTSSWMGEQLQGNSSRSELSQDPELRQAITNITHWRAYTSSELGDLPQRSSGAGNDPIAFNHGLWTWLTSMTGSKLRPFTPEEQQALKQGHAVLSRCMGELERFLVHLGQVVGERTAQLQQASAVLADTLNDNARLLASINSSKDTTQQHLSNLSQAAANLEAAQAKVKELEEEMVKLEVKVPAGPSLFQDLLTKKGLLEVEWQEEAAADKQRKDKLEAERINLQTRYDYALRLQKELDRLKTKCAKQERNLQAAAKQLVSVKQRHQDKVDRIGRWMATDRQELTEQAEALQGQLNSKQQQLDGAKERLVGKGAEVDTVSLELSELQLAVQADIKARKAQTTTNQSIQQYIKQQRKAWWQLRADKAEAAVARAKVQKELECAKDKADELLKPVNEKEQEKAELAKDKVALNNKITELSQRNLDLDLHLDPKITAAGEAKVQLVSKYNAVTAKVTTCKQKIEFREAEAAKKSAEIDNFNIKIQAYKDKAPEYARAKDAIKTMGDVHNKLKGAHDKKERQQNALNDHAINAQKFVWQQKAGEKTFKDKTIEHKQLEKAWAQQQRQTQAEQQALEMAQATLLNRDAAAESRHTAVLAEFERGDRPRKKALLAEATKVQGKLSEAEAKVGSRIRARDGLAAARDAQLKAIADAERASKETDAAIEAKVAELNQQRSSTQRAYADKAKSERSCQELGSQINRLKAQAATAHQELKEIKYEIKQLKVKRNELKNKAKEGGIAVEELGAGAGAAVGVAAGAGVAAQEGQGSIAAEPLQAAAWPSLADAGSSPVKAPRGGR